MIFEKILKNIKKPAKKLKNGAKRLEVIFKKKQKKRRGGLRFALSAFLPLGHRF